MASRGQVDISVEAAEGLKRQITVRVPNAEIDREVDLRLKKMSKTARLKGFRPGKVPAKVVRKRYGGQVRQEVVGDIIRSSFSHAVTQQQFNPAGGPAIEPLAAPDDQHFAYRATFEVYPEIELAKLDELLFEAPDVEIEEDDVDTMIERLRRQKGEWKAVDRAAADGDCVLVDFTGKIDKEPFEGGEGKEVRIQLGAGEVLEDFEKALSGCKAGDEKTAKVKFPKDYGAPEVAGKKAVFEIKVREVQALELPEVDDEFMAAFGVTEGGMEAFRADVRKNMQRELDQRLREASRTNVLDVLHNAHEIELPRALVDQEAHALQHEAMRRMGIEDHDKAPPLDRFRQMAERRVRLSLLVQELIAKEKIELDRERVEERIQELASPYEVPEEAARLYRSNADLMSQIESAVLENQVVDFLIDHGQTSRTKMSFDEFMAMQDED